MQKCVFWACTKMLGTGYIHVTGFTGLPYETVFQAQKYIFLPHILRNVLFSSHHWTILLLFYALVLQWSIIVTKSKKVLPQFPHFLNLELHFRALQYQMEGFKFCLICLINQKMPLQLAGFEPGLQPDMGRC